MHLAWVKKDLDRRGLLPIPKASANLGPLAKKAAITSTLFLVAQRQLAALDCLQIAHQQKLRCRSDLEPHSNLNPGHF